MQCEHLTGSLDLAVQYELKDLCSGVATMIAENVTAANVRNYASFLQLHKDNPNVECALNDVLQKVESDRELLTGRYCHGCPM